MCFSEKNGFFKNRALNFFFGSVFWKNFSFHRNFQKSYFLLIIFEKRIFIPDLKIKKNFLFKIFYFLERASPCFAAQNLQRAKIFSAFLKKSYYLQSNPNKIFTFLKTKNFHIFVQNYTFLIFSLFSTKISCKFFFQKIKL